MVLPLDVETLIPEEDTARTLMRIAERMNYTKLSGAYERENPREATPKQLFLPVVLGYMEGKDRKSAPHGYPLHVAPGRETCAGSYADIAVFAADQRRDPGGSVLPGGPPAA